MALITLNGAPVHTKGDLPKVGTEAPDFVLTTTDLSEIHLNNYRGKTVVLNIFPSLDTKVCAKTVEKFNEIANEFPQVIFLCVSADLPFAQKRFCAAGELENVICASVFRHFNFGEHYGVTMLDGPLAGLLARAVLIINKNGQIAYEEQVKELTTEPNYEKIVKSLTEVAPKG